MARTAPRFLGRKQPQGYEQRRALLLRLGTQGPVHTGPPDRATGLGPCSGRAPARGSALGLPCGATQGQLGHPAGVTSPADRGTGIVNRPGFGALWQKSGEEFVGSGRAAAQAGTDVIEGGQRMARGDFEGGAEQFTSGAAPVAGAAVSAALARAGLASLAGRAGRSGGAAFWRRMRTFMPDDLPEEWKKALEGINPNRDNPDFDMNCSLTSAEMEFALRGEGWSPVNLRGGMYGLKELKDALGGPGEVKGEVGLAAIERELLDAGPGSRGIVHAHQGDPREGHFFNAVNRDGKIHYLDAQQGGAIEPSETFNTGSMGFFRTN